MNANGGQALVELALCAPVVILLALGATAVVQVQDAGAGLDAATHAAASAAARAPDPVTANAAAHARFAASVAAYPLSGATLRISVGTFGRGSTVNATSQAFVEVGWSGLAASHRINLRSRAITRVEQWRTHRVPA